MFPKLSLFILTILIINLQLSLHQNLQPSNENKGIYFQIKEDLLQSFQQHFLPGFLAKEFKIPDFNYKERFDFIGTISTSLTNSKLIIEKFGPEQLSIQFLEKENEILFTLDKLNAQIDFDYAFDSNFYSKKDIGQAILKNMSMKLSNELSVVQNALEKNKKGPTLHLKTIKINELDIEIKFNNPGTMEKFLSYIIENVKKGLVQIMETALNEQVVESLNSYIDQNMAQIDLRPKIPGSPLYVDYSLNSTPIIVQKTINLDFAVRFTNTKNMKNDTNIEKNQHSVKNLKDDSEYNLDAQVHQDVFNSLGESLLKEGILKIKIRDEDLPKDSTVHLNTQSIGFMIPQIPRHYGTASKPMIIDCSASTAPRLSIDEQVSTVESQVDCNFFVVTDTERQVTDNAFTARIQNAANLTISIKNAVISGQIQSLKFTNIDILKTNIGEINSKGVLNLLNLVTPSAIKKINESILEKGISLPTIPGLSIEKSELKLKKEFVEIGVTPEFKDNKMILSSSLNFLQ